MSKEKQIQEYESKQLINELSKMPPMVIDCNDNDCLSCVLDKISAEIMQVASQEKVHDEKWALGLRYAVNIIDKYKAESEE